MYMLTAEVGACHQRVFDSRAFFPCFLLGSPSGHLMLKTPAGTTGAQCRACFHAPGKEREPAGIKVAFRSRVQCLEERSGVNRIGQGWLSPHRIFLLRFGVQEQWPEQQDPVHGGRTTTSTASMGGPRPDPPTSESSLTSLLQSGQPAGPATDS